jgi:hypothetical protein
VRTAEGPYRRERLDLETGVVSVQDLGSPERCDPAADAHLARYVRGEHRLGERSRLDLPDGAVLDLGDKITDTSWSADGRSFLAVSREPPPRFLLWTAGSPHIVPVPMAVPTQSALLDRTGSRLAAVGGEEQQPRRLVVQSVPAGAVLYDRPVVEATVLWLPDGRLAFFDHGTLWALDVAKNAVSPLFPPGSFGVSDTVPR